MPAATTPSGEALGPCFSTLASMLLLLHRAGPLLVILHTDIRQSHKNIVLTVKRDNMPGSQISSTASIEERKIEGFQDTNSMKAGEGAEGSRVSCNKRPSRRRGSIAAAGGSAEGQQADTVHSSAHVPQAERTAATAGRPRWLHLPPAAHLQPMRVSQRACAAPPHFLNMLNSPLTASRMANRPLRWRRPCRCWGGSRTEAPRCWMRAAPAAASASRSTPEAVAACDDGERRQRGISSRRRRRHGGQGVQAQARGVGKRCVPLPAAAGRQHGQRCRRRTQ